jgi:ankyrin repeat protein
MHKACYEGNTERLRAIIESLSQPDAESQIGMRDHHGWTALHVAVVMNRIEIINILVSFSVCVLNMPDSFGRTPIDYAAYHGRFESLARLIKLGAHTE